MRTRQLVGAVVACTSLLVPALAGVAHAETTPGTVSSSAAFSTTSIANGPTPQQLASSLVGAGVTISNVTFKGTDLSAGTYANGGSVTGSGTGIALASGRVQTDPANAADECPKGVEGPNVCAGNTTVLGMPGDPDLDALSGHDTHDATVLEFDFVPTHNTVQFTYVFGSDEYREYANSPYNDVFGFFVNGTNCAVVPGSNPPEPVSINTINNGDPTGDPTPHNQHLYRDNPQGSATPIDTELDGLTVPLTCKSSVTAGAKNHMKLAIADASDDVLDSAVFLQAGSFISGTQVGLTLNGGGKSGAAITVPAGTAVSGAATLTGANASQADGTLTYKVFSNSACTTLAATAGTVTVTNGSVPASPTVALSTPGTYYWVASYSGDSLNNAASSSCGAVTMTLTAVKAPTTLTGSLSGGGQAGPSISVAAGTAVTPSAALSGTNASKAGGTATYKAFTDAACTVAFGTASTVTVTNGAIPNAPAVTLTTPGTYYWVVTYSGDSLNNPSATTCGAIKATVGKTATTITGKVTGGGQSWSTITVPAGTSVTPGAVLGGTNASKAGGTATYKAFTDTACTVAFGTASTVTVTNGAIPNAPAVTLATPGTYYWVVTYNGDALNNPSSTACGAVKAAVTKTPTSLAGSLSGGGQTGASISVPAGTPVTASAVLTGANASKATGTATYKVFTDAACTTAFGTASTVTVTNGAVPNAPAVTLANPGTYYWVVSYGGDAVNLSSATTCGALKATITKSPTSITAAVNGNGFSGPSISVATGTLVTGSSTLTGFNASRAGGTVTYTVYTDNTCTTSFAGAGAPAVTNGSVPASNALTLTAVGSYWYVASYSGDANNLPSKSACSGAVANVVTTPTLSNMTLTGGGKTGATLSVYTGTPVRGKSTLSGSRASTANGSAIYTVYKDAECKTFHADAGTVAVANGVVGQSKALTFNTPGTYYWRVRFLGDANNTGSTSRCRGAFVVVHTPPPPPECLEGGLDATSDVVEGPASGTVHDLEPVVDDVAGAGDTVHDVNCSVVDPTEDSIDDALGTTNPPPPPPPPPAAPAAPKARVIDGDFDGDGDADLAVFRPSTGAWLIRGLPDSIFGANGDIPVPGDYDGDRDVDTAVYRPGTNSWLVPGRAAVVFGASGDKPVPGDYDGDGDTDIAVFRPSTNSWLIQGRATVTWGAAGDIPVPADYDGDGDTDIAVFRPASGTWLIQGQPTFQYGLQGDVPVSADYDGDRDADPAVFRHATESWYLRNIGITAYGRNGDTPVAADYDGDGDTDLSVHRGSTATWFVTGSPGVLHGASGDIPAIRTLR